MTANTPMSLFHQWLLAGPARMTTARTVILHGDARWTCGRVIQEIADYLNEYDDESDGRWLPATPELVEIISRNGNHRQLLGINNHSFPGTRKPQDAYRKTLSAIGRRGHVVCRSPGVPDEELNLASTFHAGVGDFGNIREKCHLILNPEMMDQKSIAHIIGDVFLEWLHYEIRRSTPICSIR